VLNQCLLQPRPAGEAGGQLMWTGVVSRVEKVDEEVGMNGEGGMEVCRRVSELEVY
jgi:hypothetical protein